MASVCELSLIFTRHRSIQSYPNTTPSDGSNMLSKVEIVSKTVLWRNTVESRFSEPPDNSNETLFPLNLLYVPFLFFKYVSFVNKGQDLH